MLTLPRFAGFVLKTTLAPNFEVLKTLPKALKAANCSF